jgi:hypothetical protein
MIVHVDNCYTIGDAPALKTLELELLSKGLKVKLSNKATDYISCDLKVDWKQQIAWIGQTTLKRKTNNKFKPLIKDTQFKYKTPGTPKQQVICPTAEDPPMTLQQQTLCRSAVGTLLQFSKKTRPDLANPVHDLAKCMDKTTPAAMKEIVKSNEIFIWHKRMWFKT